MRQWRGLKNLQGNIWDNPHTYSQWLPMPMQNGSTPAGIGVGVNVL